MDVKNGIYESGDQYGLGEFFFKFMKLHNNKLAQIVADTDEKDTFTNLLTKSIRTALKLREDDNIQPTDIIGVITKEHINSCVPFIAAQLLGTCAVYFDLYLSLESTVKLLKQVRPKVLIVELEYLETVNQCIKKLDFDVTLVLFEDKESYIGFSQYLKPRKNEESFTPFHIENNTKTALIVFSSGTSGLSRPICLSHYAMIKQRNLEKFVFLPNIEDKPQAISLMYSTLYWISAQSALMFSLITGPCRIVCSKIGPDKLWDTIETYKVNYVFLNPYGTNQFLSNRPDREVDISSVQAISVGGSRCSQHLLDKIKKELPKVFLMVGYGQTECGIITFFDPSDPEQIKYSMMKPTSCGKIKSGCDWKVVNVTTEKILGPNKEGELRVKCEDVMSGYYNMDSSEVFDSEGYLKTGDLVYYDDDFCFYVVGRCDESFKCRGIPISKFLLEEVLLSHPAVAEAVVIPIPHKVDTNHPMGVVVLNNGYSDVSPEEIQKFVDDQVFEGNKLRGGIKIVDELPKTSTNKVKSKAVREMILNKTNV